MNIIWRHKGFTAKALGAYAAIPDAGMKYSLCIEYTGNHVRVLWRTGIRHPFNDEMEKQTADRLCAV